jgi:hypothetical protein
MDLMNNFDKTVTVLYSSATALASLSASSSPALNVRHYDGQLMVLLDARSATGDETLFAELMMCSSATNSAATQLKNRRYWTTVATPTVQPEALRCPVEDATSGFLKVRFTQSAVSVYTPRVVAIGLKKNLST